MWLKLGEYHHAVKTIKLDSDAMQKMTEALVSNKTRDLCSEASKFKGCNNILLTSFDDASTGDDSVNLFADKYSNFYNGVLYDQSEINDIKCMIDAKLQNDVHPNYSVNVHDVVKAIHHLKYRKSDGEEGLWSDHLIHDYNLYVMLTLLSNMKLVHDICPKSMLLGTMVPIHKNNKVSLCDSDNYWAIVLSSSFCKTFDCVILLKEKDAL